MVMKLSRNERAFCRKSLVDGKTHVEYSQLAVAQGFQTVSENTYTKTERVVLNNFNNPKKWLNHPLRSVLLTGWITGEIWPRGGVCNRAIQDYDAGRLTADGIHARFNWKS